MTEEIKESDLGDLAQDKVLNERIRTFDENMKNVEKLIGTLCAKDNYDRMSPEDKVRYDLFLSFTLNSLYWLYLRTKGQNPNEHDLKGEVKRVQEYMEKSKKQYERKTMPRLDKDAAKRFIRSGLFDPDAKETNEESVTINSKKRKRENSHSD